MMGGGSVVATLLDPVEVSPLTQGELMSVHQTTLMAHRPTATGRSLLGQGGSGNNLVHHIVKEGETISTIAEHYGISSNTIFWANDISSVHRISVGDVLTILPISGILHEVRSGETLLAIANEYDVEADTIVETNDLEDIHHIFEGQELLIPGASRVVARSSTRTISARTPTQSVASGYFIRPTTGRLTQGPHGGHPNAVDIANACGTPIRAAASGVVRLVSTRGHYNGGYGNYIIIAHSNGTQTLYAHLATNSALVAVNQSVAQGKVLGSMGNTGYSTGCHLHFEVRGAPNPIR